MQDKLLTEETRSNILNKCENQMPLILTAQEVADLLRVNRSTISRYAKSGRLKSYKLGSRRLFKSEDVWSFFDNQVAWEYAAGKEKGDGNCLHPEA